MLERSQEQDMDSIVHIREVRMPHVLDENPPTPKYARGHWYYVEAHLANFGLYGPAALGVVHVAAKRRVEFLSLLVNDFARGCGLGTKVVRAIRERWPTATWSDTPGSRPFHETLVRDGIARITHEAHGYSQSYAFAPEHSTQSAGDAVRLRTVQRIQRSE
jgi:GNAT superfamily N-acetyltransferase